VCNEPKEWSVPVNFTISQLFTVGNQPFEMGVGARYWADSPDNGPEDWESGRSSRSCSPSREERDVQSKSETAIIEGEEKRLSHAGQYSLD
jgi:hypothetical protein